MLVDIPSLTLGMFIVAVGFGTHWTAFRAGYRHAQRLHTIGGEKMLKEYEPSPIMFARQEEPTPLNRYQLGEDRVPAER